MQLCRDDADCSEHRKPSIVDLPAAHLLIVLAEAHRITEVARLLRGILRPQPQLQGACHQEEEDHPVAARRREHGGQARGHALEAWELDVVLGDGAYRCHHGHTAMLDLCSPEGAEARLVALLAEARRVEVAERSHGPDLDCRVEGRRWLIGARNALLATLCKAAHAGGGTDGSGRLSRCLPCGGGFGCCSSGCCGRHRLRAQRRRLLTWPAPRQSGPSEYGSSSDSTGHAERTG